jgi:hypothetical protein
MRKSKKSTRLKAMCTHDEYNGAGYVSERHLEAFFHGPSVGHTIVTYL